eukprot:TRINITY_DN2927_c0_g9_i2.p2 TRINITY_DN2927_c0_g9~~TRINITY_DN2927_c0_g9_i2.p2  ORF type:complete len:198 (+),score=45.37 TRINITY_DN2927_c0_g9_i2:774-1367(+)
MTGVDSMPGVLTPGLCSITKSICKELEAEMKSLVTQPNLDVTIVAVRPCPPEAMMPPGSNCTYAAAPGIEQDTGKPRAIPDFIDGMDPKQEDLNRGEAAIDTITTSVISCGAAFSAICFTTAMVCLRLEVSECTMDTSTGSLDEEAVMSVLPRVLGSEGGQTGKAVVIKEVCAQGHKEDGVYTTFSESSSELGGCFG